MKYNFDQIVTSLPHDYRLGQNYLWNEETLQNIVTAADISPTDIVIEIGTGPGFLTAYLATSPAARIFTIEKDPRASQTRRQILPHLSDDPIISFLFGDALETSPWQKISEYTQAHSQHHAKIVANIPYNITKPLINYLLKACPVDITSLTLTIQRDVGEKLIRAKRKSSLWQQIVALQAAVAYQFTIPRTDFFPIPTVDSACVTITKRDKPIIPPEEANYFIRFLKRVFANKRKTLINNLNPKQKETALAWLEQRELPLQIRAEKLDQAELIALWKALTPNSKGGRKKESMKI